MRTVTVRVTAVWLVAGLIMLMGGSAGAEQKKKDETRSTGGTPTLLPRS